VTEFVEECRREWRRLGVPDPIANEMAADLSADLEEAQAEGGSPEDVLGNSAFDPRRFAQSWAMARGVTNPPALTRPWLRRRPALIAVGAVFGVLMIGVVVAALARVHGSVAVAVARPARVFMPGANRIAFAGPGFGGVRVNNLLGPLAFVVLACGLLGLGILAALYMSSRPGLGRFHPHGDPSRRWD
jgi:hypothetical protein